MKVMQLTSQQMIYGGMNYSTQSTPSNICAGCHQAIKDKYLLKAIDQVWHEDCLKCHCCHCLLGEVGSSLFVKGEMLLCKKDYLRLFGIPGRCSACLELIPAFHMVMRAREQVYHIECFSCHYCKLRFCVGDKFYMVGKRIMCEQHYMEENLMNQETVSLLSRSSVDQSDNSNLLANSSPSNETGTNSSPSNETGIDLSCHSRAGNNNDGAVS